MQSVELGAHIRRLREGKGLSLVAAGRRAAISKSTLHRTETGGRAVTPDEVASLETALGLGGGLAVEFHRLALDEAVRNLQPGPLWVHAYPAGWAGTVWVHIRPRARSRQVRASILWGSWSRVVTSPVPEGVLTLVFGKGSDGQSVPLSMTVDPDCTVIFGFGPPISDGVLDVNDEWTYEGGTEEAFRRVGAAFQHLLRRSGRTIEDLANVLGASVHEVRAVLQLVDDERPT